MGNLSKDHCDTILVRIQLARKSVIAAFRCMLSSTCISPLLEGGIPQVDAGYPQLTHEELGEEYMHVVTACLAERHFFLDYSNSHPLRDDLDLLLQVGVEIDPMRVQYIFDIINEKFKWEL